MRKEKELSAMKKFIKKMAIAVLTGAIAFSVVPATVQAAGWKQNKNGYWWQENDYSYPKNQWKTIYGKQYHFNSKGYMDTDWTKVDGKWYYFGGKNDGAKKTYWQKVRGKYYWLGSNGVMRTGWQNVYGKYYWLGSSNDGAMKTGWQKVGGKFYWLGHSNDGAMKTGWQNIYKKKYYLDPKDGFMKTGWQKISGNWYYFGGASDGSMKSNTWVDDCWLTSSGKWDSSVKRDLTPYLNNMNNMISTIGGTRQTHDTGDFEKLMVKDGMWYGNYYGIGVPNSTTVDELHIYSAKYSIYGLYVGQNSVKAKETLLNKGWSLKKEYKREYYEKENMGIHFEVENEKVSFIVYATDYLEFLGQSMENDADQPVVESAPLESPQQESDTTETEIPDTEANSEEPALPETTEQETSDATQNENNTTEIEEEQATQEEQVSEEESTEETQQVEENKEENQSSEIINE